MKNPAGMFSRVNVDPAKITNYLLNPDHESGEAKAVFFARLGFSLASVGEFADALSMHCTTAALEREERTEWGTKYTFSCEIRAPKKKGVCVISVWQVDKGGGAPRLITAFPSNE